MPAVDPISILPVNFEDVMTTYSAVMTDPIVINNPINQHITSNGTYYVGTTTGPMIGGTPAIPIQGPIADSGHPYGQWGQSYGFGVASSALQVNLDEATLEQIASRVVAKLYKQLVAEGGIIEELAMAAVKKAIHDNKEARMLFGGDLDSLDVER